MKTKQFKISEILQWQPQKEIDPLKINELTVDGKYTYPFYGQATLNHGIISYETLTPDVLNNKDGKPTILIHSNAVYSLTKPIFSSRKMRASISFRSGDTSGFFGIWAKMSFSRSTWSA